ncbi:hypothetical protein [Streptomyces varsoviensis]|uniref:Uncharacterized protein n=1 Tax=Streptomyces varsoviensis TaxID=67373 RepID=A0ABR5J4A4_9ACTN|nr:hypothetical protein [Streptomyces varsoviensis]KOG88198.1 hypothetical protein ADK38_21145 [Streptomyces varsoviensis]
MADRPTDEEILRAVRRVLELEDRHDRLAARVTELRVPADEAELAERDRTGDQMAKVAEALVIESIQALEEIGMVMAAQAVEAMAAAEGIPMDSGLPPHEEPPLF